MEKALGANLLSDLTLFDLKHIVEVWVPPAVDARLRYLYRDRTALFCL